MLAARDFVADIDIKFTVSMFILSAHLWYNIYSERRKFIIGGIKNTWKIMI